MLIFVYTFTWILKTWAISSQEPYHCCNVICHTSALIFTHRLIVIIRIWKLLYKIADGDCGRIPFTVKNPIKKIQFSLLQLLLLQ